MRTTVNLDEHLLQEAKRRAVQMRLTLGDYLNHVLRQALVEPGPEPEGEFQMVVFGAPGRDVSHEPSDFWRMVENDDARRK